MIEPTLCSSNHTCNATSCPQVQDMLLIAVAADTAVAVAIAAAVAAVTDAAVATGVVVVTAAVVAVPSRHNLYDS